MGRLILTIGAGKNGTHTLADALSRAGVASWHELEPKCDAEGMLAYVGLVGTEQIGALWHVNKLAERLHELLSRHPVVHVANCCLTPLAGWFVREFSADLIHLRRNDWLKCVASWVVHGAHWHNPYFIQPHSQQVAQRFMKLSPVGRAAWYVRQSDKLGAAMVRYARSKGRRAITVGTEELVSSAGLIADMVPCADYATLAAALCKRNAATADDKLLRARELMQHHAKEIELVASGELDEGIPAL